MKKANRIYTDEQINAIVGILKGSAYVSEVQAVLAGWGKKYSDGHIQQVAGGFRYSEPILDALRVVAMARRQKREEIEDQANQLVEQD